MRILLVAALVAAAPLARADDAGIPGLPMSAAPLGPSAAGAPAGPAAERSSAAPRAIPSSTSRFGLLLETGIPEGLALGLTFRPVSSVRLWAGPAWNYLSFGGQLGLAVIPFRWAIAPTLSLEAGRYVRADLSRVVNSGTGAPQEIEPLLRNVSYDYVAAHLGLEVGSQRGLAFSLRAGLAYVRMTAHGRTQPTSGGTAGDAQIYFVDPQLDATIPSVKLGLQYAF